MQVSGQLGGGRARRRRQRAYDQERSVGQPADLLSGQMTQSPAHPVTHHGRPDSATHHKADPGGRCCRGRRFRHIGGFGRRSAGLATVGDRSRARPGYRTRRREGEMGHHGGGTRAPTATGGDTEVATAPQAMRGRKHVGGDGAQAASRERPLRRRPARIARPARVRIRRRKPCVLCRRRLFGWKVRLLTEDSEIVVVERLRSTGAGWLGVPGERAERTRRRQSDFPTVRGPRGGGQTARHAMRSCFAADRSSPVDNCLLTRRRLWLRFLSGPLTVLSGSLQGPVGGRSSRRAPRPVTVQIVARQPKRSSALSKCTQVVDNRVDTSMLQAPTSRATSHRVSRSRQSSGKSL